MPADLRTRESAELLVEGAWAALCEGDPSLHEVVGPEAADEFIASAQKLIATYYSMENPTAFDAASCEEYLEVHSAELPLRLRRSVPRSFTFVAESGVQSADDLLRLLDAEVDAALVGTVLMSASDPGQALRELVDGLAVV